MKLNLKVRIKNPTFWLTFIPALVTFIFTLLGLFDVVPAISESEIINFATVVITLLTNVGVLVDPTTKGLNDSERALGYEMPN